jgi:tetratricopeptide (TPR) repeat protein
VTNNRMPRWLSEGISVYEERQRDPAWGMKMTADWRRFILEEDKLTPMSQMSSAFLNAKDGDDILFAYYESSMAVEWLIAKHGWESFRKVLRDLASGDRINTAIEKNIGPMETLEPEFLAFMTNQAKAYAPLADWGKVPPEATDDSEKLIAFLKDKPTNLQALSQLADQLASAKEWKQMAEVGQRLIELNPEDTTAASGYWIKGKALHQMKDTAGETVLLRAMAAKTSDSMPVYLRLLELDEEAKALPEMEADAARALALNPFLPKPNQALATAAEATGKADTAILLYDRLLHLNPANPALVRYKLATLLREKDAAKAKRHLLDALVLAPRYREALELLKAMP